MMICPVCGKTYSYGSKLHHSCKDHVISCGIVFSNEKRRSYEWNCIKSSNTENIGLIKLPKSAPEIECLEEWEILDDELYTSYEWNCNTSLNECFSEIIEKKDHSLLVYE